MKLKRIRKYEGGRIEGDVVAFDYDDDGEPVIAPQFLVVTSPERRILFVNPDLLTEPSTD